jgi:hypothetical protein
MQYTSSSFAQPIRRVFGSVVFQAREIIEMPPPSDPSLATMRVQLRDIPWELIYLPLARAVSFTATHLNGLQFLTIRRYLTFVFLTLVLLLLVLATWG